jgi:hypothetical protein
VSLVKLFPAFLHALGDYAAGIVLFLIGIFADGPDAAKATGIVLGAVLVVGSLLTRYPLGAVRVIPFPVHSAGDYIIGILAIVFSFALGFWSDNTGVAVAYLVIGIVVVALSLLTNYDYGEDRGHALLGHEAMGRPGTSHPFPA